MLAIFRQRGGPAGSTLTIAELRESEKNLLERKLKGDRPLIAQVESDDDWFAVTTSQLVSSVGGRVQYTRLADIEEVALKRGMEQMLEGKLSGGSLDLKLRDGSLLTVQPDGAKPFMGLLNLFMMIAAINRRERSGKSAVPHKNE
jgi:hypothetical protein